MAFNWRTWLRSLSPSSRRSRSSPSRRRRNRPLSLEQLEVRLTPSTDTWIGLGNGNYNWSNLRNWSLGRAPQTGDDLVFSASAPAASLVTNNDLTPNTAFNSITIAGSGYTLGGAPITLGNAASSGSGFIIVNSSSTGNVISFNINMGGAAGNRQFFTVNFAADLTLTGKLLGSTGVNLTKEGTGTLILRNDNSAFTGPITVDQGILQITNAKALGDTSNGTIVAQNAQLQVNNVTGNIAENLILNGPGVKNDGALLNVAGSNTWTGTIEMDSDTTFGASAGSLTLKNTISDLGAGHNFTKEGLGQIVLAHANTYRGVTTINNGILTIRDPLALGSADGTAATGTTVNSAKTKTGTLQIEDPTGVGFTVVNELLTLNGPGFTPSGGLPIGALDNLNGNNTWTANVLLGSLAPNGSDVSIGVEDQGSSTPTATNLTLSGVVQDPNGIFNLNKIGPGRLIFTNANTYRGQTNVVGGYLNIRDSQGLGSTQGSTVVEINASLELQVDNIPDSVTGTTNTLQIAENLTIFGTGVAGSGALHSISGINVWNGTITLGLAVATPIDSIAVDPDPAPHADNSYFTNDYSLTVNGVINGGKPTQLETLGKEGNGQLILTAANTYLGPTLIGHGWVTIQNNQALGGHVPGLGDTQEPFVTVLAGAALHLKPLTAASPPLNIPYNLALAGNGIAHPFGLINHKGALMNLGGINTATGYVQFNGQVGVGVELLAPATGSELTMTGSMTDYKPVINLASTASGGSQENDQIIDTGSTSGKIVVNYNMFVIPDVLRIYDPPQPGGTKIFDTGSVSGVGVATANYSGNSTLVEIIMDEGGGPIGTFWTYTAQIFPDTFGGGGILKLGSKRLNIQGDGTYTGADEVKEGVMRIQNDAALGDPAAGTTVESGAALELANSIPQNAGGATAGIQIRDEHLTLNGTGNTTTTPGVTIYPLTNLSGDNMWRGPVTLANSTTIDVSGGSRLTLNGTVDDAVNKSPSGSGIDKIDGGTLALASADTFRGTVHVEGGILNVQNSQALGSTGIDEVQTVTVPGTGMFQVTFNNQTTGLLPVGIPASGGTGPTASLQNALNALASVSGVGGSVTVTLAGTVYTVTFGGSFAGFDQPQMSASGAGAVVATVQDGAGGTTIDNGASLELQGDITIAGEPLIVAGAGVASPQPIPVRWFNEGPGPLLNGQTPGNTNVSGRVAGLAVDPTDPNVVYLAAAGGGAWKTYNSGQTWLPLFDDQGSPIFGGAVAVAPSDPRVVYFGTGEADNAGDDYYGSGVWMSADSGHTWTQLGGPNNPLVGRAVSRVVVDPTNPNLVYAAVSDSSSNGTFGNPGVWRFDGTGWFNLTAVVSNNRATNKGKQGAPPNTPGPDDEYRIAFPQFFAVWSDLAISGGTLYAALGTPFPFNPDNGVFRCPNPASGAPVWYVGDGAVDSEVAGEYPTGVTGHLDGNVKLTVTGTTIFAANTNPGTQGLLDIQVSSNGGVTWAAVKTAPVNYLGNQGWYDSSIVAADPNTVYVGGVDPGSGSNYILETTDGGTTWKDISTGADGTGPHTDVHALVLDSTNRVLIGTDGGIYRHDVDSNNNPIWVDLNGNLQTIQFNNIDVATSDPNFAIGASQDNGTEKYTGSLGWTFVDFGDGGGVQIDHLNPNNVYHVLNGTLQLSTTGGNLGSFNDVLNATPGALYFPFVLDSINTNRIVVGAGPGVTTPGFTGTPLTAGIVESPDQGATWISLNGPQSASAVALATYQGTVPSDPKTGLITDPAFPLVADHGANTYDPDTIYAFGIDPNTGVPHLEVTKNHGTTWAIRDAGLPSSIQDLEVDPRNRDTAYVVSNVFGGGHVFATTDAGMNWTDISGSVPGHKLPNLPTWKLVVDPRNGFLYVGNDEGVWLSKDAGSSWDPFGNGLPQVQVHDMVLNQDLNTLTVGTHGRSMFQLFLNDTAANAGGLRSLSGSAVWTGPVYLSGPTTISAGGTQAIQNGISAATLNIVGTIADLNVGGDYQLTKIGSGDVILSGDNTYGGPTVIQQGVLVAHNPFALGSTANGTFVAPLDPVNFPAALEIQSDIGVPGNGEPLFLMGDGVPFNGHNTGALRNVSNFNTYYGPITLQTNSTIGVDSGSQLTIVGTISKDPSLPVSTMVSLTKELPGTLVLNDANTYDGTTFVNQGALRVENGQALGGTVNGTVVLDGAQLQLQQPAGGPAVVVVGEPLLLSGTGNFGTGALLNTGGNNTWRGPITLTAQPGFSPPTTPGPNVAIGVSNAADTLTIAGPIGETAADGITDFGLAKVGLGTLVLQVADTYTGLTAIDAGILRIQNPGALGTPGGPPANGTYVTSGATLQLDLDPLNTGNPQTVTGETLTLNGAGVGGIGALDNLTGANTWAGAPIVLNTSSSVGVNGGSLTVTGDVQGPLGASLTKVGTGTLFFPTANDYLGLTLVQNGILNISNAGALGGTTNGTIVAPGATLQLSGSNTYTGETLTLAGGGYTGLGALLNTAKTSNTWSAGITLTGDTVIDVVDLGKGGDLTLAGPISESGGSRALTEIGNGTLTFTGGVGQDNTYTGLTTVTDGVLLLNKSGGAIAIAGPVQVGVGSAVTTARLQEKADNQIADASSLLVNSDGTFDLSNQSDTIGAVTVHGGTVTTGLRLSNGGSLTASGLTMIGGTALAPAGSSSFDVTGLVTLSNGAAWTASGKSASLTAGGLLTETDSTIGLTALNSSLTASGGLNLTGGAINLSGVTSVATLGGDVTATSDAATGSAAITTTGNGTLALGAANRTFTVLPGGVPIDLVVSAIITGGTGLTKAGAGSMQLTNTNTYSGGTTLTAGDLYVDGPAGQIGDITVNGGRLLGTGTVGAITANGGSVIPGDNPFVLPGLMASTGNTTFSSKSTFGVELGGTTPGNASNDYTQLNVSGTLNLGGANLTGAVGLPTFVPPAVGASVPTFTILHSNGALSGQFAQGSTVFFNGLKFGITYDTVADNVNLTRVKATTTTVVTAASLVSPSTFGQKVTFTATVTPEGSATFGFPNGTVTFTDGTSVLGTVPVANVAGVATATYTTFVDQLTGGSHSITATYNAGSDPNFAGGTSAAFSYLVNALATTTTITNATPVTPSTFGTPVTFTATVTPTVGSTEPTGTVMFKDGTATLATVSLANSGGVATATYTTVVDQLAGGSHTITAVYTPAPTDLNFQTSTSAPFNYSVNRLATTTAITGAAPVSPQVFGTKVTFTATVTPTVGTTEPTGTVAFMDGTTTLATVNLSNAGAVATATYTTTVDQLKGGTHSITAVYAPASSDLNFQTSTSAGFTYTVTALGTTTTLTGVSPSSPADFGTAVSFTAIVLPTVGATEPTGTVTFTDGTTNLGTAPLGDVKGTATAVFTTTPDMLAGGTHSITAAYTPASTDHNFLGSSTGGAGAITFTVDRATTTTTVTGSTPASPSTFGTPVTFTVTVTPTFGTTEPTGTVTLKDGTTTLGTVSLANSGGTATATFKTTSTQLLGGSHVITAVYTPALTDPNYQTSTSANFAFTVSAASTTTVITQTSPGSSTFGQPVTFTATVTPTINGIEPTGTVSFLDGGTTLGSGTLGDVSGTATATFTTTGTQLTGGSHNIVAVYNPAPTDLNFQTSASAALNYAVARVVTSTAVTGASPAGSSTFGQAVTFTAVVTPAVGGVEPTGTVNFFDGATPLGTGTLANLGGKATATFTTGIVQLIGGSHTISAVYVPGSDPNYVTSTSANFTYTVNTAATTTRITGAMPASPTFGQALTFTATVAPNVGGVEPTGTVNFFDGATPLGSGTLADANGVATATYTTTTAQLLSVGGHNIGASYVPGADPNYKSSTSANFNLTVTRAPSSTTITAATPVSPSTFGEAVTFTATVTPSFGAVEPTGTVTFKDGSTTLGFGTLQNAGGTATATFTTGVTQLLGGTHSIIASYAPAASDPNYQASTSLAFGYTVSAASTTTLITQAAPPSPTSFGQQVTFVATVTPVINGVEPTGSVSFKDGTALLATVPLGDIGGTPTASYTTAIGQLLGGSHSITAVYNPGTDPNFATSTSPTLAYTIILASTTTTITAATPATPTTFGTPVTFTVTVTPRFGSVEPTGTVTFKDGSTTLGTGTLADANGTATATFTTTATMLAVGSHSINAVYNPGTDPNYQTSNSTAFTYLVNKAATTTTVTAATPASPSTFGQVVTFTVTVTPSFGTVEPTGSVTFKDGSTVLGSVSLADASGTATATLTTTATQLLGGSHNITAVYVPGTDPHYLASTSGNFNYTVNPAGTITSVTGATPVSPTTFGQQVTFTATVTPTISGVEPTGTVAFKDGSTTLGSGILADSGGIATATYTTTTAQLSGGAHTITAVYTPGATDTNFQSSGSANFPFTVNAAGTTTTVIQATPAAPTFGQPVTFSATVTPSIGGVEPTGTVTFKDAGVVIGSGTLANAGGTATATFTTGTTQLAVGGHTITAVYNPGADPNYVTSTSTTFNLNVGRASTTTTVAASTPASPAVFGSAVTFTATVAPTLGSIEPTGSVTFKDGSTTLGSGTLADVGGVATATFTATAGLLTGGTHAITATYAPGTDPNFKASSSGNFSFTVTPAGTTTNITGSTPVSPAPFGQTVTFTATVTPTIGGIDPTGTVTFKDGTTVLGSAGLGDAAGTATASFTTSATQLVGGTHSIVALYTPAATDQNYQSSTSGAFGFTVSPTATTTTVTAASPAAPNFGQAVTFTATVTPAIGGVEPTGNVTFKDGSMTLGSGTLSDIGGTATATFTTAAAQLTPGVHTITASYAPNGNPNYQASSSQNFSLTVGAAATTTSITSASPVTPTYGQVVTFTAKVTPNVGTTAPTGSVTFTDTSTSPATVLCSGPLAPVGGVAMAMCATTATQLGAGSHTITASYNPNGDPNYATSTSMVFGLNVNQVNTTTVVASTSLNAVFGQAIITATVTPTPPNPGAGNPPGSVTFHVTGGPSSGDFSDPVLGNTATLSQPLDPGTYTITASYVPTGLNFTGSTGSLSQSQVVQAASTSLTLTSSPTGPVSFGQPVTFTATVTTTPPGSGTPTGNVTFTVDGTPVSRPLDSSGHATLTTVLGGGSHSVTASYGGGKDFVASNGGTTVVSVVNRSGSSTTLSVSSPTFFTTQAVTLTAHVTGLPPGTAAATGTVTFFDGSTALGTAVVVGGQASLSTTHLPTGGHALRAVYSGDGNYVPSEGDTSATNLGQPIVVSVTRVHGRPQVQVFNAADHSLRFSFFPYGKSFKGPVRVVVADVNGDGFPDVVVAPGHGPAEPVLTFNGRTGALIGRIAVAPHAFARGLYVAAGDINGDGRAEVIVGVGTEIRGYDGVSGAQLFRFAPFGKHSTRLVRVAVLDVNEDGVAEFFAVAGGQINGYDGRTLAPIPSAEFGPFSSQIMGQAAP
jgi:autotransporter-associated beta strand protein